jgi:hypothetical protein
VLIDAAEPMVALVRDGRLVFASPEMSRVTRFTHAELTGPSFHLDYLFADGHAPVLDARPGEPRATAATLQPLRGDDIPCAVTVIGLDTLPPTTAVLFEPGAPVPTRLDPLDVHRAMARLLVRGIRSHMAREITELRRLQEVVERLEHAHHEHVTHHVERLALAYDALARLETARSQLAVRFGPLGQREAVARTP